MRSWLACILVVLVSAPMLAQTGTQSQTTTTTTTTTGKSKPKTATKKRAPAKKAPTTASEIKTLREAVNAQQQQIQMLKDELARRDAAMQQVQTQLNSLQSTAQQAQTTAQTAESTSKANEDQLAALKTNVGTIQTTATATATSLQATEKAVKALESPVAIKYKGVTITPGGFISANVNWRQHAQNLDNFANFGGIPFNGQSVANANSHMAEFRETARYSRLSLLIEGKTKSFNVQNYYEIDFEGAAQTANENQTNSFTPRLREAWLNIDAPKGVSFAAGQTWSLLTANRTGVGPRGLMLPAHIDASLVLGFHYTRQNTFRVYKKWDLANKKAIYLAFAAEESQETGGSATLGGFNIYGLQGSAFQPSATAPNGTFAAGISINPGPDLVGKVAIEPGWGHFELAAIGRFFRDRIALAANTGCSDCGSNHTTPGGGISFNGVMPVVAKKVDIVFATLAGRGVGRYDGVADIVLRPDGRTEPLMTYSGYLGVETHPSPKFDFLVYAGDVYVKRTTYYTGGTALLPTGFGYGLIGQDLRGCTMEQPTAGFGCSASNKNNWEITPGFWYRFYRGPAGTVQFGAFWEHIRRTTWAGRVTTTNALPRPLNGDENILYTAMRWYFP